MMATQQGMLTFDAEVGRKLEAMYSTSDVAARRRAALEAVQLEPGEYGLDIGPGPGFLTCELAQRVGRAGRVAAVDNNPAMLALTEPGWSGSALRSSSSTPEAPTASTVRRIAPIFPGS